MVDVIMMAYNHERFVAKAIEGFLLQKTTFPIRLIIANDGSKDKTREIADHYCKNHPDKIVHIYNDKNIGGQPNFQNAYKMCNAKYIAMCDGDDYWIDDSKIQKQVDFLEKNHDYSICYHRVWEELPNGKRVLESKNILEKEVTYTIEYLAKANAIHTPSVLFRNQHFKNFPSWFNNTPAGDYVLHMLNAKYGKIKYFPDIMAVYRIHGSSTWSSQSWEITLQRWLKVLTFLMSENFGSEVLQVLKAQKIKYINDLLYLYLESDMNAFVFELEKHSAEFPEVGKDWLLNRYPKYISDYKNSTTYKLVKKIVSVKDNFTKKVG